MLEEPVGFAELARLSFESIRSYGADNVLVVVHLLHALDRLAGQLQRPEHRAAVLSEAEQTAAAAREALRTEADLKQVQDALDHVRDALANEQTPDREPANQPVMSALQ